MRYYLDTNILIYVVEGQSAIKQRAIQHISALEAAGHSFVVTELSWTECLVSPLRSQSGPLLLDYQEFLTGPNLVALPLTAGVYRRAASIRAYCRFGIADALHLASAIEYRCDRFLTNDQALLGFADIAVEALP